MENTFVAVMRIFKQRVPPTGESAISPVRGPSIDAANKFYAASVLGPLADEIALARFGGAHCLNIRTDFQATCPGNRRKCNLPSERLENRLGRQVLRRVCAQAAR